MFIFIESYCRLAIDMDTMIINESDNSIQIQFAKARYSLCFMALQSSKSPANGYTL